jgi:hypothetical protein
LADLEIDEPLAGVADHAARLGLVQGILAESVVDLAVTESGRQRILAELRGRRWAEERAVGVPEVVAAAEDGRWLLSRRVHSGETGGKRWTEAAVDAAVRIAPQPGPDGEPWTPPGGPSLGRARAKAEDTGRLLRSGVRLGELRAIRAAARALPLSEVSHGDFRAANAVLDGENGGLVVLEWVGVQPAPRHRDLLTLWATTPDDADRQAIAEVVRERTAAWEGPDVGLLWHAVALEQVVARVTRPDRGDGLDLRFARSRLAEARRMAAQLSS